jgi:hypothetical protein
MKVTSSTIILVVLVSIVSTILGRTVAPYIYKTIGDTEGFESKNLDTLQRLIDHIDIVDIKHMDNRTWWEPKMSKAIKVKGLKNGLVVKPKTNTTPALNVHSIPYNRGGLRLCNGDPCSDNSQWSFEFSTANDLLYRLYPKGHMPSKEVNERKRLIYTPGSWYARIFQNQSKVVNRPPPSWFSGSR